MPPTTRPHDWHMIVMTPMVIGIDGLPIIDHTRPAKQEVGCVKCNMGYDEGKGVDCPEQDLFEEDPDQSH